MGAFFPLTQRWEALLGQVNVLGQLQVTLSDEKCVAGKQVGPGDEGQRRRIDQTWGQDKGLTRAWEESDRGHKHFRKTKIRGGAAVGLEKRDSDRKKQEPATSPLSVSLP